MDKHFLLIAIFMAGFGLGLYLGSDIVRCQKMEVGELTAQDKGAAP